MPDVNRISRNWLNLRLSVGIVPCLYRLFMALWPAVIELALLCFAVKNLLEFRDEATLLSMKLSSVASSFFALLEVPRVGALIWRSGSVTSALLRSSCYFWLCPAF